MHLRSSYSLEELIDACEVMLRRFGFISHKSLAKEFGVTRQAIQLRLRRANERNELSDAMCERFHPSTGVDNVTREYALSPTNDVFVQAQAEEHQVRPAVVVDAAVSRYRESLNL